MNNNLLFIYTHPSSFVKGDISILEEKFKVYQYQFINNPKSKLPFSLLKQLLFLILNTHKFSVIYIWFADYHSFLPILLAKLYRKKSCLVIGGYDICREKKYGYGSLCKPLRAFMTITSIKLASYVLAVSKNVERTLKAIAPTSNSILLYNGITRKNTEKTNSESSHAVLCVALVNSIQTFYIKGIDRLNSVAEKLPDTPFFLVGCNKDIFTQTQTNPAPNLTIIPPVPQEQLVSYYQKCHIYCQPSRRESFSVSLAEAMFNNMIPVVSSAGGMPEVIQQHGYTIYMNDSPTLKDDCLHKMVSAIKKALKQPKNPHFREHIIEHFSTHLRRKAIFGTILKPTKSAQHR